ncbi:diacylglycerol/lipid kinase family protein [Pseudoalteromonas sp. SSDWG2]|uniref:diacylglycerol/lipid kinase family protein n=1 Tax=Pseudoalteromonas sp. SSDWG2 TaxID=3139391 RepID=UPI003BABE286
MAQKDVCLLLYHPLQANAALRATRTQLEKVNREYIDMATSGDFLADVHSLRHHLSRVHRVIVLGGDGTLNLAVNALAHTDVELALVPCGSGNDFARQWRCSPQQWIAAALSEKSTPINVAQVNERYFINIAGVGYDAEVVKHSEAKSGLFAHLSYTIKGLRHLYRYVPPVVNFTMDDKAHRRESLMLCIANGQFFGAGMHIAPQAHIQGEQLSGIHVGKASFWQQVYALLLSYAGKHVNLSHIEQFSAHEVVVSTPNIGIEADGEYVGLSPAAFKLHKHALRFVIPKVSTP